MNDNESQITTIANLLTTHLLNFNKPLLWLWQIVMGVAMASAAFHVFDVVVNLLGEYNVYKATITVRNAHPTMDSWYAILFFLLIFIPTFIRFFFGDIRYFNLVYVELFTAARSDFHDAFKRELASFTGKRRLFDITILLIESSTFVFLGNCIADPRLFLSAYCLLLFTNVLWLFVTISGIRQREPQNQPEGETLYSFERLKQLLSGYDKPYYAPTVWAINNTIVALLLLVVLLLSSVADLSPHVLLLSGFFLCLANSAIDLGCTWFFYFPKVMDIFELAGIPEARQRTLFDIVKKTGS